MSAERDHYVWLYPPMFFYRRLFFICASVYLFEKPAMQMIVHQLLTLATLVYLVMDKKMYQQVDLAIIEITTEFLLLLTSILFQEFLRARNSEQRTKIGLVVLIVISLMILVNVVYIVYTLVKNFKDKRHKKRLEK